MTTPTPPDAHGQISIASILTAALAGVVILHGALVGAPDSILPAPWNFWAPLFAAIAIGVLGPLVGRSTADARTQAIAEDRDAALAELTIAMTERDALADEVRATQRQLASADDRLQTLTDQLALAAATPPAPDPAVMADRPNTAPTTTEPPSTP